MNGTVFFQGLSLVCAAASVVFAATGPLPRGRREAAIAVGFGLMLLIAFRSVPELTWVAGAIALVAAVVLARPAAALLAALGAGASAAMWVALLRLQGTPFVAAALVAATPVAVSAWLADRQLAFAPPALREEALMIVLASALVLAAAPELAAGWQSATALNVTGEPVHQVIPGWALSVALASATLGGVYRLWVRG